MIRIQFHCISCHRSLLPSSFKYFDLAAKNIKVETVLSILAVGRQTIILNIQKWHFSSSDEHLFNQNQNLFLFSHHTTFVFEYWFYIKLKNTFWKEIKTLRFRIFLMKYTSWYILLISEVLACIKQYFYVQQQCLIQNIWKLSMFFFFN